MTCLETFGWRGSAILPHVQTGVAISILCVDPLLFQSRDNWKKKMIQSSPCDQAILCISGARELSGPGFYISTATGMQETDHCCWGQVAPAVAAVNWQTQTVTALAALASRGHIHVYSTIPLNQRALSAHEPEALNTECHRACGVWAADPGVYCMTISNGTAAYDPVSRDFVLLIVSMALGLFLNTVVTLLIVGNTKCIYSGPSILRPPMGPWKCGLILQVVLK